MLRSRSCARRGWRRTSSSSIPVPCSRSRKTWCTTSRTTAGGCGSWPRGSTAVVNGEVLLQKGTRGATRSASDGSCERSSRATCSTLLALQAVQHLQRQLVTAERRHQIRALDALAHREQHLARDLHAFLAPGLAAGARPHPLADHFGDLQAGAFAVEERAFLLP